MARTSKRNNGRPIEPWMKKASEGGAAGTVPTAAYVRFSAEKEDVDSVQNQMNIIKDFARKRPELEIKDFYIDNGFSGTSFERPEFIRMMKDVKAGKLSCIVVKDLSRFGRNFIETGYYLETLLPGLNVRVIAVNDNFDSSKKSDLESIAVPVRNMVNELYAKDISRKICCSNEARRQSGRYTIERSIYGYTVDKDNNEYVVNEETAPIVQLIFKWYLEGVPGGEIARRLNLLGIETPNEYKYRTEFKKELKGGKHYWDSNVIYSIMRQRAYTGDRCLGMRRNALYRNQKNQIRLPEDQWYIYSNDHTPLVTREDFEKAAAMMDARKAEVSSSRQNSKTVQRIEPSFFRCKVFCKNCGKPMWVESCVRNNGQSNQEGDIFVCRGHGGMDGTGGCALKINEGYLESIVAERVRQLVISALEMDEVISKAERRKDLNAPIWKIQHSIGQLKMSKEQVMDKITKLYEDLGSELIDSETFREVKSKYQADAEVLQKSIEDKQEELENLRRTIQKFHDFTNHLKSHADSLELTRELSDYLIEKIDVISEREIEVVFKCRDAFEDALDLINGGALK